MTQSDQLPAPDEKRQLFENLYRTSVENRGVVVDEIANVIRTRLSSKSIAEASLAAWIMLELPNATGHSIANDRLREAVEQVRTRLLEETATELARIATQTVEVLMCAQNLSPYR